LKAQVEELSRKNQKLEAQLSKAAVSQVSDSSYQRLDVRVTHVSESTSEQRIIDLVVNLRGESPILDTVITRILEFLRQVTDMSLISIEASTHTAESTSFNQVVLRLNIEVCMSVLQLLECLYFNCLSPFSRVQLSKL
jgi:CMP-2-keto-3-deoxyoctulosonic acid synthetase